MSLTGSQYSRTRLLIGVVAAFAAGACQSDKLVPPTTTTVSLGLTPAAVAFRDTVGTSSPAAVTVTVTNTGTGSLTGLGLGTIAYSAGASGWLTAVLGGTDAPANLALSTSNAGLAAGTYTATVPVTANSATNSPQSVAVTLTIDPTPAPTVINGVVVVAAGNIAQCGSGNNLAVASSNVVQAANPAFVFALGDNAYPPHGSPEGTTTAQSDFDNCYGPNWGRFKSITYAAVGNREQDSMGVSAGADAYYGVERVGPAGKNYYSFNVGTGSATWHIVVLDIISGGPTIVPVRYDGSSAQLQWLYNDLRANSGAKCTLAFWHDPMWMSSNVTSSTDPNAGYRRQPQRGIWMTLYDANADLVLGGGDHIYERFAPMRYVGGYAQGNSTAGPEFAADPDRGIRQFSTGLAGDGPLTTPTASIMHPLSESRSGGNGVLKLTLGDGEYTWQFLNATNSNVIDSGYGRCH